jgi:hypothetical protein
MTELENLRKNVARLESDVKKFKESSNDFQTEAIRLQTEVQKSKAYSSSPALDHSPDGLFTKKLLSHPVTKPFPDVRLGSTPAEDNPQRTLAAERLLTAYQKSIEDEQKSPMRREGEDLWTGLIRTELPELMAIIEKMDAQGLADYLMHFGESFIRFGGITTCIDGYTQNLDPRHVALTYLDKLICLGEYLGLLRCAVPDTSSWGTNLHADIDELIEKIEETLEISITPPTGAIHTDGLETAKGLFHYRHINGLYGAIRVRELCENNGPCCEFGGGLGMTAMYARRMGVSDYTMLDLPITCLLAGHYLLHSVGLDAVSLYGEQQETDTIKLLPYWECLELPEKHYALAVNQDSFPEIADNLVMEYLVQIKRMTKNYFLSINHENFDPRTVNKFVKQANGYKKVYRSKYWIREGYVEELFRIQ